MSAKFPFVEFNKCLTQRALYTQLHCWYVYLFSEISMMINKYHPASNFSFRMSQYETKNRPKPKP